MQDMNAIAVLRDLRASGMPEAQAEVIANVLGGQAANQAATKRDLEGAVATTRRDLEAQGTSLKHDIKALGVRLDGRIDTLDARFDARLAKLQNVILGGVVALCFTTIATGFSLAVKLAPVALK